MTTDAMDYKEIEVTPQSAALGAVISGVDLSKEPSKHAMAELEDAFGRYSVIFFRDQNLTPQQHIALAERWGAINVNRFFKPLDGYPQIAQVIKEANQKENIGGTWHTDHSYDLIPAMGSILCAREVPTVGGDTLFSSMYLAYQALSEDMKKMLTDLKAWHSSRHAFGYSVTDSEHYEDGRLANPGQATQDALHPVVITHPLTGRKRYTLMPISPSALTTGLLRNRNLFWICSTPMVRARNSPAAFIGSRTPLPFGTTAPHGTTP